MSSKPDTVSFDFEKIPQDVKRYDQWTLWRWALVDGKWTKWPIRVENPSRPVDATDSANHLPYDAVVNLFEKCDDADGIAFVIMENDPFTGGDLDGCVNGRGLVEEAAEIVRELATYTELSPSGTGVKLLLRGSKGDNSRCSTTKVDGFKKLEVYDHDRFWTMTGRAAQSPAPEPVEAQEALDRLMARYLPKPGAAPIHPESDGGSAIVSALKGSGMPDTATDDEVLQRMFEFRNGAKVRKLFETEPNPDESRSEDDAALVNYIAFASGPDPERIDRLFRRSARMRPKWDARHYGDGRTYGQGTVDFVLAGIEEFYTPKGEELDPEEQARRQDETIAREFVRRHEGEFLYVAAEQNPYWLKWNGNRWTRDPQAVYVRRTMIDFGRTLHDEAEDAESKSEAERLHSHGKRLGNASGVAAVLKVVEVHNGVAVDPAALDADPDLLSVANGTLELRTDADRGTVAGRLRPADPADLLTRGLDVAYKSDADSSLWDKCGREWFPESPEKWRFLEDLAGYHGLHGAAGRIGAVNEGGTYHGKSTLETGLDGTLGELSYAGSMSDFAPRQSGGPHSGWARTLGKRIGFVSEGEDGLRLDEGLVKRALGGAVTSFEEKYEKSRQALPTMTPIFDTNHLPTVDGADDAIFKRLKLVEWGRRFYDLPSEQALYDEAKRRGENPGVVDRKLDLRLTTPEAKEGILAALVRALVRVDRAGGVEVPESVAEATRRWQAQANTLSAFVEDMLDRSDADNYTPVKDVLVAFNEYAKEHGRPTHSQDWLSKELKKAPFWIGVDRPYINSVRTRCYMGVRLRSVQ